MNEVPVGASLIKCFFSLKYWSIKLFPVPAPPVINTFLPELISSIASRCLDVNFDNISLRTGLDVSLSRMSYYISKQARVTNENT